MLTRTEDLAASVDNWLGQFERALVAPDPAALNVLFHEDSYWRDVLALNWEIRTISGADAIATELKACSTRVQAAGFAIASRRTSPRRVSRAVT